MYYQAGNKINIFKSLSDKAMRIPIAFINIGDFSPLIFNESASVFISLQKYAILIKPPSGTDKLRACRNKFNHSFDVL